MNPIEAGFMLRSPRLIFAAVGGGWGGDWIDIVILPGRLDGRKSGTRQ